ncbi:MAG: 3'-5' exonuclease [Gemmatimonadaceae bacterium]
MRRECTDVHGVTDRQAADGWFPSSRALRDDEEAEEERRLMYVAMTRARHALSVVVPVNVYGSRWGADYSMAQLSRFIDADVRKRIQRRSAGPAAQPARWLGWPTADGTRVRWGPGARPRALVRRWRS